MEKLLRIRFGLTLLVLMSMSAVVNGCYSPDIVSGGLGCAAGDKCPDGFKCNAADRKCYKGAGGRPDGGSGGSGGGGAGGSGGTCTTPPVTEICQEAPKAGQACNPTCQKGCACGRCNVVTRDTKCTTAGTRTLGQVCNLDADDCVAGMICLREACGGNPLGRCYRHCTRSDQCMNTLCQIPIQDSTGQPTGFLVCDVTPQDCDPVAKTGCPDPALNCYLTSANQTLCDCPNKVPGGGQGDACTIYSDCAPGYVCVSGLGGLAGARCNLICKQGGAPCPTAMRCIPSGPTYGYCGI